MSRRFLERIEQRPILFAQAGVDIYLHRLNVVQKSTCVLLSLPTVRKIARKAVRAECEV